MAPHVLNCELLKLHAAPPSGQAGEHKVWISCYLKLAADYLPLPGQQHPPAADTQTQSAAHAWKQLAVDQQTQQAADKQTAGCGSQTQQAADKQTAGCG